MDWFLYDNGLRHERVKSNVSMIWTKNMFFNVPVSTITNSVATLSVLLKKYKLFEFQNIITWFLDSRKNMIYLEKLYSNQSARIGKSHSEVFLEISQNLQENTCPRASFLIKLQAQAQACNFTKKETLVQVFSCEFFEISKNTFSCRTFPVTAFPECVVQITSPGPKMFSRIRISFLQQKVGPNSLFFMLVFGLPSFIKK